jgi:nitrogen fixation NifU-like protein
VTTLASPTSAELGAFFQDVILDHYRRPRNKRPLPDANAIGFVSNPLCGDEMTVYLSLDGDLVRAATFSGQGCSIAQASASMMTQAIEGRTVDAAQALRARMATMLDGGEPVASDGELDDLVALSAVAKFPARIQCAMLPWEALAAGLARRDMPAGPVPETEPEPR